MSIAADWRAGHQPLIAATTEGPTHARSPEALGRPRSRPIGPDLRPGHEQTTWRPRGPARDSEARVVELPDEFNTNLNAILTVNNGTIYLRLLDQHTIVAGSREPCQGRHRLSSDFFVVGRQVKIEPILDGADLDAGLPQGHTWVVPVPPARLLSCSVEVALDPRSTPAGRR